MSNKLGEHSFASSASYWGILVVITAAGAAWLLVSGPFPVVRGTVPLHMEVPFFYMLSAFPFLGMLVAELAGIVANRGLRRAMGLMTALALLVGLSFFRVAVTLPVSGHLLLIGYFISRRIFQPNRRSRETFELFAAGVALLYFVYMKLVSWSDPVTLSVGLLLGGAIFGVNRFVDRERVER